MFIRVALPFALLVGGACASPSQFQTARVLPKGETRVTAAGALHHRQDTSDSTAPRSQPQFELHFRQGILEDRLECGGKFYGFGLKGDCKVQLWRTRFLDVSGAPALGFTTSFLSAHILDGYLSVLVGLNLVGEPNAPRSLSVVTSMTHVMRCWAAEGRDPYGCALQRGFSGGLHLQVSDSFAIIPEVSTMRTVWGGTETLGFVGGPWVQGGIGLQFRLPARSPRATPAAQPSQDASAPQ